jgi:hypothetical protein
VDFATISFVHMEQLGCDAWSGRGIEKSSTTRTRSQQANREQGASDKLPVRGGMARQGDSATDSPLVGTVAHASLLELLPSRCARVPLPNDNASMARA